MSASKVIMPFSEANVKLVSSYYRRALRSTRDWINRPDYYRLKCLEIRRMFEINREIHDPNQLRIVLAKAEKLLADYEHPDPIIPPQRPGGTKFERNIPPRQETMVPSEA